MLILEGPDGGGKTTLAHRLAEDLGWSIAPRVVTKNTHAMVDIDDWVEENLAKGYHTTIYDRHRLISEPIYGSVLQRFPPGRMGQRLWLEMMFGDFDEINPTIVYCLPPFDVVERSVVADPDNIAVAEHIFEIYHLYYYKAAADERSLIYDYTQSTAAAQYTAILHEVRDRLRDTVKVTTGAEL